MFAILGLILPQEYEFHRQGPATDNEDGDQAAEK